MNREVATVVFFGAILAACVAWRFTGPITVAPVITPPKQDPDYADGPTLPTVTIAPPVLFNAQTASAAPYGLATRRMAFLPPVQAYMENRGSANDGF